MSLFLVTILATTGVGLAMFTSVELLRADQVALDLDHRLAAESALRTLPSWIDLKSSEAVSGRPRDDKRQAVLKFGDVVVECAAAPESGKLNLASQGNNSNVAAQLRSLAGAHGLLTKNIKPRPILETGDTRGQPNYVWFDQLIAPTQFEEVFRWRLKDNDETTTSTKKTWSDLLTFWQGRGNTYSVELVTGIGSNRRHWYGVVDLVDRKPRILYLGAK